MSSPQQTLMSSDYYIEQSRYRIFPSSQKVALNHVLRKISDIIIDRYK